MSCQKNVFVFSLKKNLHKLYNFCKIFGVWGSSSCISLGSLTQTQFTHGLRANLQSVRDCNFIFDTLERSCLHYSLVVGWVGTNDSWTTKHKFSVGLCHHQQPSTPLPHTMVPKYSSIVPPLCYIRRQCSWCAWWWCAYPASLLRVRTFCVFQGLAWLLLSKWQRGMMSS